jgi:hypothetical protein
MNTFEKILYDSMVEITNTSCNVVIIVSRLKSNTKRTKFIRFLEMILYIFCDENKKNLNLNENFKARRRIHHKKSIMQLIHT